MRAITWLEASRPTIEPAAMPKMRMPIDEVDTWSACFTAGMRDAQLAIESPHSPKMTKSALRQATTCGRESPAEVG